MIRSGKSVRFTPNEVDELRQVGVDLEGVRTQDDVESALATWAHTLADERPDLLEKIVLEMAKAKGVKPPPKLNVVPSSGSPRQS